MADEVVFTVGRWLVKQGSGAAFIEAWKALGDYFLSLPQPPGPGTLVQSAQNPGLFYSFGAWPSAEAVSEMRANPSTAAEMAKVSSHCEEFEPGMFRQVATAQ